jgi:[ribosomal protein S18]-alanine N-acetyltransferase
LTDPAADLSQAPGEVTFGPATPADFVGIAGLDARAWRDSPHPERIPDGEHVWRVWVDDAFVFVARHGDEVVGAIVAFPTRHGTLFVHKVMVDVRYRERGIGTRLFRLLLDHVDATVGAACSLTVGAAREAEVRRYEHLGFIEKRFIRGYYREDEDRFVLTRPARGAGPAASSG